MTNEERVSGAAAALRAKFGQAPEVAVVLGSGLGCFADELTNSLSCATTEVPGWPASTAPGHRGRLVLGGCRGKTLLALQGRVHYYETGDMEKTVFPVRALAEWGVKTLLVTNASGGIDLTLRAGDLVVLEDHINFMGANPLVGPNKSEWGPRFPDMTKLYDADLRERFLAAGAALGLPIRTGVYVAFSGPSYETPAEIRAARAWGAHVVGMSTVPEVITARHMGLRVACVSCVANAAAGVTGDELTEEEVLQTMNRTGRSLAELLALVIEGL